jgi:hypothetical protein
MTSGWHRNKAGQRIESTVKRAGGVVAITKASMTR